MMRAIAMVHANDARTPKLARSADDTSRYPRTDVVKGLSPSTATERHQIGLPRSRVLPEPLAARALLRLMLLLRASKGTRAPFPTSALRCLRPLVRVALVPERTRLLRRLRPRVTFANVVSILALFVALGGTTYAAATIGSNEIKTNAVLSRHIKNGQVKTNDLGDNSVNGPKLAHNAVSGAKVSDHSLTGSDIDQSSLRLSNVIARPVGGKLAASALTTSSTTPYPLASATFRQRPGEIVEFVTEVTSTLAHPSGSG